MKNIGVVLIIAGASVATYLFMSMIACGSITYAKVEMLTCVDSFHPYVASFVVALAVIVIGVLAHKGGMRV